ncbi:MAG: hypothetical protein QXM75_00530 [Candidatus Diapherotrites archaeon]
MFLLFFAMLFLVHGPFKTGNSDDVGYYKNISKQIHNEIQQLLEESKKGLPNESDVNFEDVEEVLQFNLYISMTEDIIWLAEIENKNYEKILGNKYEIEIKELTKKEIACYVLLHYILLLNINVADQISETSFQDRQNAYLELADSILKKSNEIKISEEFLESFKEDFGLKIDKIERNVQELFSEYLGELSKRINRAKLADNLEKAYIESVKITNLASP